MIDAVWRRSARSVIIFVVGLGRLGPEQFVPSFVVFRFSNGGVAYFMPNVGEVICFIETCGLLAMYMLLLFSLFCANR